MKARILATCVSLLGLSASSSLASEIWWQPYSSDANTIGLWHFDDVTGPSGTFADSSPGANTGTLYDSGGITLTVPGTSGAGTGPGAGMFGKSLNFSPSATLPTDASYLNWGTVPDNTGQLDYAHAFTIEAWFKPAAYDLTGTDKEAYIVGKRSASGGGASEWNLGFFNGKPYFEVMTGAYHYAYASAGNALTADTWYHIAGVATDDGTNTTATIYLNGAQVATATWAGTLAQNADPLVFGNRGTSTAYTVFNGQLDEVRYSDVAREYGAAVPEPASLSLLAGAGLLALRRRRRK